MPIKKSLLILLLIAVVGFIFVFTVYYYKNVLSIDLFQNKNSYMINSQNNDNNIEDPAKIKQRKINNATESLTNTKENIDDIKSSTTIPNSEKTDKERDAMLDMLRKLQEAK